MRTLLDSFTFRRLMADAPRRLLDLGARAVVEDDPADTLFVVDHGSLVATVSASEAPDHVVAVHRTGDVFGELDAVRGPTAQPTTVTALERSVVAVLTVERLTPLLQDRAAVDALAAMLDHWANERMRTLGDQMGPAGARISG